MKALSLQLEDLMWFLSHYFSINQSKFIFLDLKRKLKYKISGLKGFSRDFEHDFKIMLKTPTKPQKVEWSTTTS